MHQKFMQGFVDMCKAAGVDPEVVAKASMELHGIKQASSNLDLVTLMALPLIKGAQYMMPAEAHSARPAAWKPAPAKSLRTQQAADRYNNNYLPESILSAPVSDVKDTFTNVVNTYGPMISEPQQSNPDVTNARTLAVNARNAAGQTNRTAATPTLDPEDPGAAAKEQRKAQSAAPSAPAAGAKPWTPGSQALYQDPNTPMPAAAKIDSTLAGPGTQRTAPVQPNLDKGVAAAATAPVQPNLDKGVAAAATAPKPATPAAKPAAPQTGVFYRGQRVASPGTHDYAGAEKAYQASQKPGAPAPATPGPVAPETALAAAPAPAPAPPAPATPGPAALKPGQISMNGGAPQTFNQYAAANIPKPVNAEAGLQGLKDQTQAKQNQQYAQNAAHTRASIKFEPLASSGGRNVRRLGA